MSALRRLVVATSFAALGCTPAEPQPVTQPAPPEQEEELALEPLTGIWSEVAPLAAPRSGFATAVTEASVLVAGGLESEAPSASLSHYDPEIGEIGLGALPAPAFGAAAFVRDDVFFIVGGIASTNASPIVPNDTCHRWAEGALAPCATIGNGPTSHAAAVTADGYGYLVGGLRLIEPASGSFPTMVVQRLDLAADEWRAETHLPEFRDGAATFVHGGKLFVVGGRTLDQQTV